MPSCPVGDLVNVFRVLTLAVSREGKGELMTADVGDGEPFRSHSLGFGFGKNAGSRMASRWR